MINKAGSVHSIMSGQKDIVEDYKDGTIIIKFREKTQDFTYQVKFTSTIRTVGVASLRETCLKEARACIDRLSGSSK